MDRFRSFFCPSKKRQAKAKYPPFHQMGLLLLGSITNIGEGISSTEWVLVKEETLVL